MICRLRAILLYVATGLFVVSATAQDQVCPININFSSGNISGWSAKTGLVNGAVQNYPYPNNGISSIPEYSLSTTGINVITNSFADPYGGFSSIPLINGYSYEYSVKIGSNSTSWDLHSNSRNPGGFTRSVTYTITVPAGSANDAYTMTYAYALVLENGTHNSNQQPLFKATLNTPDSIITCASPSYYLPTLNNAGQGGQGGQGGGSTGATLDSASAKANGFKVSPVLFLSHEGQGNANGTLLQDVWTKDWTEVTFDLSAYRGRQVTLTFEADNCTPGAHFAYAYVALRNNCAGLSISGPAKACANTPTAYSIPSLANANYEWTVPPGWNINSGSGTNIINVTPGTTAGIITVHSVNGCADLRDTVSVSSSPPTVAGKVITDNTVCAGTNSSLLNLGGQTGTILNWIYSTDGNNWIAIANTTNSYTAQNLGITTLYKAVVQNGSSCSIDSSAAATIIVNPKTVGGVLSPQSADICAEQTINSFINLTGNTGSTVNWQYSFDGTNWVNFSPVNNDSVYNVKSISATTLYRTIVQSGVCPADTSSTARVNFITTSFPAATINPAISSICYGKTAQLNATITTGTNYIWTNSSQLTNSGNGIVSSLPYTIHAIALPVATVDYILTITNAGCPNSLMDTFHVDVTQPIKVFAGNDTSIVIGEQLQLNASANDPLANIFTWSPSSGLSSANIYNPMANLDAWAGGSITYIVRAINAAGCYGEDNIKVTIFKTPPDIFVPSAFSPNGDGKNDVIKPICVGITQLNYFRIYNRWGQLIFNTSEMGKGWDGSINGTPQATANFVFIARGIDFTGRIIERKGNIVLIR